MLPNDPTEPIEKADPVDPKDIKEFFEPILRIESVDPMLHKEKRFLMTSVCQFSRANKPNPANHEDPPEREVFMIGGPGGVWFHDIGNICLKT